MSKHGSKRITMSQTVAKGNLEDILHAIEIEETPIVQAKDIDEGGRNLKKGKTAKKLEFAGDEVGFMFQARKPMKRHARKVSESSKEAEKASETIQPSPSIIDLSSPTKEDLVIKQKKGKDKITEKTEVEALKEQLKEAREEISVLKKEAKKHRVERIQFKQMSKIWEDQVTSVSKTLDNLEKMIKWTQQLRA